MAMYPDSFKTEVAERNNIEDVVSEYVTLSKRSGSTRFGLCPFHNEKTPSFSVTPSKQIFHCFGCGKGGDVITFVREIENLTYPEALEFLARRANIPIPTVEDDAETKRRSRTYELNRAAARFFYEQLGLPSGEKARQYVVSRKITPTTATNFGLGYAPDSWFALQDAMHKKGFTDQEMVEADLIRPGKKGFYDTFRNRLIFPVIDVSGRVIGFSGRILGDGEPKYLNSKETVVFNKGRNLFGLNLAKKSKAGYIILVEGNVDVVSLHQAGFDSAVASLGTSLTVEQARLLSRYTDQIILAYDSDGAGLKAAQRGIEILEKLDVHVKVLRWEGAKDPDDYIKLKGAGAFRNLIEQSEAQIDYRLKNIRSKYDFSVSEQKVRYLEEATDLIAGLSKPIEREVYGGRVAEMAGINRDRFCEDVERRHRYRIKNARIETERKEHPESLIQPADRTLRYENPKSAAGEEGIIRMLYLDQSLCRQVEESISSEEFTSEALKHLYRVLFQRIGEHRDIRPELLGEELSGAEMSLLIRIIEKPENMTNAGDTLRDYIQTVRNNSNKTEKNKDLRVLAEALKGKGKGYTT